VKTILITMLVLFHLATAALADSELPVENGIVTSGIGWRLDPFGSGKLVFHRGIDIAVPVGTPVRAIRQGRVILAGDHKGHGSTVILEHANGDRTLYGHNALIRVHYGELVESGAIVAFSGNSGRSTGPHVHFEQLAGGRAVVKLADAAETGEISLPQRVDISEQRFVLDQNMDNTVNSVIRILNKPPELPQTDDQGGWPWY